MIIACADKMMNKQVLPRKCMYQLVAAKMSDTCHGVDWEMNSLGRFTIIGMGFCLNIQNVQTHTWHPIEENMIAVVIFL